VVVPVRRVNGARQSTLPQTDQGASALVRKALLSWLHPHLRHLPKWLSGPAVGRRRTVPSRTGENKSTSQRVSDAYKRIDSDFERFRYSAELRLVPETR